MKAKYLATALLLTGMTALGGPANASDEVAGALIGVGAGALIGHSIDRCDGAVIGGILGAMVGAAIADDDDDHRRVVVRDPPRRLTPPPAVVFRPDRPVYGPPPVVVYEAAPRVRYVRPVIVEAHPMPYGWRHDRRDWRDDDRYHDRGRGHPRGW